MVDSLVQNLRATWQLYAALLLVVGNVAAFAGLPARVQRLEERVSVVERVARYQGCRFYFEDTGRNPKDCSVIYRDLEEFLTDPDHSR